jgi:choline dehydrogenase-like flavoprotein
LNLCKRTPQVILEHWERELGIEGVGPADLAPFYDTVERDLGVVEIPEARMNVHNQVLRDGVTRLGWRGGMLSHNRDERCVGSGFCELGCFFDAKMNARRILVPQALEAGARITTDARVDRVLHDAGRVKGVRATLLDASGESVGSLEVRARVVCLAGSAIGSALLALRSGLPDYLPLYV